MAIILVISPHDALRQSIVQILHLEGWQTIDASDAATGAKLAAENQPTLIIGDADTPRASQVIVELLRRDDKTANIPLVLIIGNGNWPDLLQTLGLTADQVLIKQFDTQALLDMVRNHEH
jgi:DNA-binding response OmpR family regulator